MDISGSGRATQVGLICLVIVLLIALVLAARIGAPTLTLERAAAWSACIGPPLSIVAFALAYIAYAKAVEDNRYGATLAFVGRDRSGQYLQSSLDVRDAATLDVRYFAKIKRTEEQWRAYVSEPYRKHNLLHSLFLQFQYYDELFGCVARQICDWEVGQETLKEDLGNLIVLSQLVANADEPAIQEETRLYWTDVGCGYAELVKAFKGDAMAGRALIGDKACPRLVSR